MPNFGAMSDVELRQFKSAKNAEIRAARTELLAAEEALQRKRAASEERWRQSVRLATMLGLAGDEHSAAAERFYTMEEAQFAAEAEKLPKEGLSREERRASHAQSTTVLAPPASAAGRARPGTGV
jgi:hypothetical protein